MVSPASQEKEPPMSGADDLTIARVRVLQGHTDPDSAYLVEDYPYGRTLRCRIRYWIDTATKGAANGKQRFARQTSNPKRPGHPWNTPHYSTYAELAVLYLDEQDHVQWWGTGLWMSPVADARARLMGIVDQLTAEQARRYRVLLAASQAADSRWDQFDEVVTMLAAEIGYTGTVPQVDNGVWTPPAGHPIHLGADHLAVYVTAARQRAADTEGGLR
jgi:hypothetical protein